VAVVAIGTMTAVMAVQTAATREVDQAEPMGVKKAAAMAAAMVVAMAAAMVAVMAAMVSAM